MGNAKCKLCERGWISNTNKTYCIDTYRNLSSDLTDDSSIIMLSVSCTMLSGISSSIFLFIKHRETPIIKSSNIILSFLQLTAHLLTVIVMPFLFIGEPNVHICILKPVCVGLLLTLSTAVTLSKTTTFLKIFQSKVKMTAKQKSATKFVELIILVVLLICDIFILVILFNGKTPEVIQFVSDNERYREVHCTNDLDVLLQFSFIFFILSINSIQAIRARHLPSNFKETRIIILANLLSCVIVGNVIWSYFFQTSYYWRTVFLFYAVFLLNGINFIILYSYKIYIIMFLPELNSKKYFNECVMKKIKKQANRL